LKLTKEIKTAILVISSILLFIWGYSFLKGTDMLTNYKTYYVLYDDVEGLNPSAPVTINGLIIGKVKSIDFQDNSGKLIVELQVRTDFPISKSSIAKIYEPGLIGGKQVQIVLNFKDNSVSESGDYLKGEVKPGLTALVTEKLTPLQEKLESMLVNADKLLVNLNDVMNSNNKQHLNNSFEKLSKTLSELSIISNSVNKLLNDNSVSLTNSLSNIEKMSSNFEKVSDSLSNSNIKQIIANLEKTLSNVDQIMVKVNSGNGTIGKLLKDEALYNNMSKTSKELELLLQDLRLYPTRYVNVSLFGKKNKPYVAPVNDTITKVKK